MILQNWGLKYLYRIFYMQHEGCSFIHYPEREP
jgi:hypothetical protein